MVLKKSGLQCNVDYTMAASNTTGQIIIGHKPEKKVPSITAAVKRYESLLEQTQIYATYIDNEGDPYLVVYHWNMPNFK